MKLLIAPVLLLAMLGLLACSSENGPSYEGEENIAVVSPVSETAEPNTYSTAQDQPTLAETAGMENEPTPQPSEADHEPQPTEAPTAPPSPTPPLAASDNSLSQEELYKRIAPSIAFIETPIIDGGRRVSLLNGEIDRVVDEPDYSYTGSGVLLEGGYILAAYLVVWPYRTVRVVFADGSEYSDVPVVDYDPLAGWALLGPVDTPAPPLTLANGESTALGSELFLIVYAEENESIPEPVIGRGSLQALWEPDRAGITYFQTDISVADGVANEFRVNSIDTVSGGALVNGKGELIGISTPIQSSERLTSTMAASAADIAPIVTRLINRAPHPELGDRLLASTDGEFEFVFNTRDDWDIQWEEPTYYYHRRFLVREPIGTVVDIDLTGNASDLDFSLQPFLGLEDRYQRYQRTINEIQHKAGSVELKSEGPHLLTIRYSPSYNLEGTAEFEEVRLRSNFRLRPLHDPDDGKTISVGDTIAGSADLPLDNDWFRIGLTEGEAVLISGESVASYRYGMSMGVDFPGSRENQKVLRRGEGGGILSANDFSIVYRAPHSGDFFIEVSANAGYYLTVEMAPAGAEPVFIPPIAKIEGDVSSPFGPMTVYKSELGGFSIQVPAGWYHSSDQGEHDPFAEIHRASSPDHPWELVIGFDNRVLSEFKESAGSLGLTPDYLSSTASFFFLYWLGPDLNDDEFESLGIRETAQGIPMERSVISPGEAKIAVATYYLADSVAFVGVAYTFPAEKYDELKGLAEYSFSTFLVE